MADPPVLAVRDLRKRFGPNQVLHGLGFDLRAGEFVGLMGPNGAGKSTLVKILAGVYTADSGTIEIDGTSVSSLAGRRDVGFIHQDLGLIDALPIVDNLRLGRPALRIAGTILAKGRELRSAREALDRVGLDTDPRTLVGTLSPGEKALVAVARLLDMGARVIVVDEATSTLPFADSRRLIRALAGTVAKGSTVIVVSHKLSEILDSTQRVIVILDGRIAADEPVQGLDRAGLVHLLMQHEELPDDGGAEEERGEELLRLDKAAGGRAGPVNLSLHRGEVLGLTGLPGSGLHDIAYLASGAIRPRAGSVGLPQGVQRGLVPPHRESQGGFPLLAVSPNLTVSSLRRWRSPLRLLRVAHERRSVEEMIGRLRITPPDPERFFGTLSGGNKQKVVFGRVLFHRPDVYVLCEPTRGVDVGTRSEIYRLIRELRSEGAGVLLVTSDSEDIFAVCDRVGVVENGRVNRLTEASDLSVDDLERVL